MQIWMKAAGAVVPAMMLFMPVGAMAQSDQSKSDTLTLNTITVTTPMRRETTLQRSTSSVTVIDRQEIDRSAAPDLPSLLKSYSGVSITSYGGQGASANVYLRGMSATQTLVLINGVRASSATSGTTSIFNIPLSSIERIEIAKGGHSSQYGADAMGGVINIITKRGGPCADGRNFCASLTTGVTNPWGGYVNGSAQGQHNGVNYAVGGSLLGTEGYDFTTPQAYGHEPDKDGFKQGSVNFSVSSDFDWGRLYADGLFAKGRSQYDATYPGSNQVDTTTFAGKLGARVNHAADWFSTVEVSTGLDYTTNFRKHVPGNSQFDTKRYGVFASTEKSFDAGALANVVTAGVEAYRESVNSSVNFDETSRTLSAVFGQYSFDYDALHVDSGIRYDHNGQFGDATTYNIGASYQLTSDLALRSSYATGFRAPTFNDLYYPNYSNPDLKPEKSRSYEVGLKWQAAHATSFDIAFYQTWLTDAIASNPPTYLPFNVARARITGFEASVDHQFNDQWRGKATIDIREPINQDNGKYIPNRDRFKAMAELGYSPIESLDLTARVLYGASRYANAANTVKLGDYITADFSALYRLDQKSEFKFSVENIFDEQYETISTYRAPGRTFNLGFTRSF